MIVSGKLVLRRLEHRDLPLRVAWLNDSRINSSLNIKLPVTLAGTEEWFGRIRNNENRADFAFESGGIVVAMGGLTTIDREVGKAELYIFVDPDKENEGIGTNAVKLMCKHGFEELGLGKIYLHVNSDNVAARKVYEKCSFRMEGLMRREIINNGKLKDRCVYALYSGSSKGILLYPPPINEFGFRETPFFLCHDMELSGKKLKIVRDDLFPGLGGGNKSRKMEEYARELTRGGYNAVVTTGGIQSNHCRAVALMAAQNGWRCHVVYHGTRERFFSEGGNAALVRASGSSVEFVDVGGIAGAMDAAMSQFRGAGLKPYYITGGGHDLPGGNAYMDAAMQLFEFGAWTGYKPDVIFLASGTGSTQAGILVGLGKVGWGDVKVVGISVARRRERATNVIAEFVARLARAHGLDPKLFDGQICVCDEYLCGGYEKSSEEMREFLSDTIRNTGVIFDPTYSGKALWGMKSIWEKSGDLGNVFFWHTGGIMNFLAQNE